MFLILKKLRVYSVHYMQTVLLFIMYYIIYTKNITFLLFSEENN